MDSAGLVATRKPRSKREDHEAELKVSDRLVASLANQIKRTGQRLVQMRRGEQARQKYWRLFQGGKEQSEHLVTSVTLETGFDGLIAGGALEWRAVR